MKVRIQGQNPVPARMVKTGDRRGMLLRGGDFADGELKSIGSDGQLELYRDKDDFYIRTSSGVGSG